MSTEPDTKKPFPFPTAEKHDDPPLEATKPVTETPTEDAIDHGVEESFPASDPVSVTVTKVKTDGQKKPD
ncbi:conserved hypothetical protein [Burkholderiales bacterium 8X]|nr:conserved hypothetical protein [Burkholderiales bacterium 8X]